MKSTLQTATMLIPALACALLLAPLAAAQAQNPLAPKSDFITTPDGIRIHYFEAGWPRNTGNLRVSADPPKEGERRAGKLIVSNLKQAPALLFVPGWTMPAEIWEKQLAHFARTEHAVAMDPRSQGDSTKAEEGHYPAARARDIKAAVDQLKLAPVVLVGWSMGVNEAAAYVDQFGTDTLAGLVLVDGIAGSDFSPDLAKTFLSFLNSMQKDRRATTETFVRSMFKTPQSDDSLRRLTAASMQTPTNSAVALVVGSFWTDNRPALAKIDKPTLIVVAAGSPYSSLYQDLQRRIAGARLEVFENVGHALFVDDAPRFNALLDDFLKTLH